MQTQAAAYAAVNKDKPLILGMATKIGDFFKLILTKCIW